MRSRIVLVALVLVASPALALPWAGADPTPTQSDGVLASFDGAQLVYTLFEPGDASPSHPVPAILMTHGWAGSRQTTATGIVAALLARDYAVLTWDSRGFGQSGGFIELDSPQYEVKDASAMIDLLASKPEIQQDHPGDPRVGMTGSSYAGGIQLLTAAFDHRVDAITPDITWNDLRQSLGPNGVGKLGWIEALFGSGLATGTAYGLEPGDPAGPQATSYDANLPLWWAEVHATNQITSDVAEGLRERSPTAYIDQIRAPTLFTQGLPDTLFNANEAAANFHALEANDVPTRLVLGCFGHAGCPYVADDAAVQARVLSWLDHYVKGDTGAGLGPKVEWFDNAGVWHASGSWPPQQSRWLSASADATLVSTPAPTGGGGFAIGAGGVSGQVYETQADPASSTIIPIATAGAGGLDVAGDGHVRVTATGVGTEAFLFFRLLDVAPGASGLDAPVSVNGGPGQIVDGQTQAFRMPVLPTSASLGTVDLVGVGYHLAPGHTLALQVSTSDFAHASNRQPGAYQLHVDVGVPTLD